MGFLLLLLFLGQRFQGIRKVIKFDGVISTVDVNSAANYVAETTRSAGDGQRGRPAGIVEVVWRVALDGDGALAGKAELRDALHLGGGVIWHRQQSTDAAAGSDDIAVVIVELKIRGPELSFADPLRWS